MSRALSDKVTTPVADAEAALAHARAEIAILNALSETLRDQIAAATRAAATAEARVDGLVSAAADRHVLHASVQALERRLDDLRQGQRAREAVLAEQLLTDGAALRAARAETDELRARLDAARNEAQGLRGDLARVFGSLSWRVTRPLRALRRLLGAGKV